MKREKLNLGSIKNVLSRAELKKIMAGSGIGCIASGQSCSFASPPVPCCGTCVGEPGWGPTCV